MPIHRLHIPCPASDCKNPNKQKRFWYHARCGGYTALDTSKLQIVC